MLKRKKTQVVLRKKSSGSEEESITNGYINWSFHSKPSSAIQRVAPSVPHSLVTKSEQSSGHKIFHCLRDNTSDLPVYHIRFYLLSVHLINLGFLEEM